MLVIDASVVVPACTVSDGFAQFAAEELIAPPLLWSEVRSALHEAQWRGEIDPQEARDSLAGSRRVMSGFVLMRGWAKRPGS